MKQYRVTLEIGAVDDSHAWILARQLARQPQGHIVDAELVDVAAESTYWHSVDEPKDEATQEISFGGLP